jgi:hypothetical protein
MDQLTCQQEQAEYVGRICEKQNSHEQPFRMFQQSIEPDGRRCATFHVLAQSHRVDRQESAFDSVEEERNNPATENDEADHHAAALV